MYNAENKKVDIDGSELWYDVFGTGTKPLVMIPGLNLTDVKGTANKMSYFYRRFAKDFRVYIFDKRSTNFEGCTIRTMAEDVAQAMKKLGIGKACVLGVSQGGMIAQQLTVFHPELVSMLVLGVTAARPNPNMEKFVNGWVRFAESGNIGELVRDINEGMYTDEQMKKYKLLMPIVVKMTKVISMEKFIAHAKAVLTCGETWDKLESINCPTLVIGAEQDKITTPQGSKEIAEKLGCKAVIMKNEGHAAYLSDKFNKMVYDFFIK